MEKIALKISPPPSPNRDKFPFVGTARVQGLVIDLENLAGSVREGEGPSGKVWRTKMRFHYGEIRKTEGTDKDKLDVYIGPNPQSKKVFIVHQNHPGNHPKKAGQYDEDKVMLGFNSAEEAKRGYLKQYDRKDFFRSITEMPIAQFKKSIFKENKGEKVAYRIIKEAAKGCSSPKKPDRDTLSNKLRRFSRNRKKDKRPSAYIREQMKIGSLKEAYALGAKTALAQILSLPPPESAKNGMSSGPSMSSSMKVPSLSKGAPSPSSEGTSSGAMQI